MDSPTPHSPVPPEDRIPEALAQRMASIYGNTPPVPRELDEAILRRATGRLRWHGRWGATVRWGGAAAAVAAVLLLALWLGNRDGDLPAGRPVAVRIQELGAADRVTILDAYRLAQRLGKGESVDRTWDADGDGRVNERDVDAIARAAVRLPGVGEKGVQ